MPKLLNGLLDEIESKIDLYMLVYQGEKLSLDATKSLLDINIDKYKIENEIGKYGKKDVVLALNELIKKIGLLLFDPQTIYIISKNLTQASSIAYGYVNTSKVEQSIFFYYSIVQGLLEKYSPSDYISKVSEPNEQETFVPDTGYYDRILHFEYEGKELFDLDTFSLKDLGKNLRLFEESHFESIVPKLNFIAKHDYYAYFAITKLAELFRLEFTEILNVLVNGKEYDSQKRAEAITKNKSKESQNPKDGGYAGFIKEFNLVLYPKSKQV
jgi:hypothetical protein